MDERTAGAQVLHGAGQGTPESALGVAPRHNAGPSSIPPSVEPDSIPLNWIPESAPLSSIPESRILSAPPPAFCDPISEAPPSIGRAARNARLIPATLPPPADLVDLVDLAPPSSRGFDSGPPSNGPESVPLHWIPESAPISSIPESRPIRITVEDARWRTPTDDETVSAIARRALGLIFSRRRLISPVACPPACDACLAPHLAKAESYVRRGAPIHLVLPAFPAKSPNPRKVLGPLPDMAEVVALTFLQNLCTRIRSFYSPGAKLTICSDGRVFSDVVRVTDSDVSAYGREINVILETLGADAIETFNLEDQFGPIGFDKMRDHLVNHHARPLDEIQRDVAAGGGALSTFNGMARFLFEDMIALEPDKSRSLVRKITKVQAYTMIQRSNAWSSLVERVFPNALRLSIHPQPAHADKIGVHLVETLDNWLTPWHATAVKAGGRFVLMKRYHAERMNASLVWGGLRPSHFVAPTIDLAMLQSARSREPLG